MTDQDKLQHCQGCIDDFYNGNNPLGVTRCWSFEKAHLVEKKEVGLWQRPPWNDPPKTLLSCFRRQGFVYPKEAT